MDEPDVLFHYTDAAGLIGIIGRSDPPDPWTKELSFEGALTLRASDVLYLNDKAELRFGAEVMTAELEAWSDSRDDASQLISSALLRLAEELREDRIEIDWATLKSRLAIHAACFCETGDLLSQWRGYGANGGGYAIGIPREVLAENTYRFSQDLVMMKVTLHQVWYGRGQAAGVAHGTIDRLVDPLPDSLPMLEGGYPNDFGRIHVMQAIAQMKDEGFAEESEWRLITETSGYDFTEFRPSAKGVVPYIDLYINPKTVGIATFSPLPRPEDSRQTIASLVVGPGPDQELRIDAVKRLLLKNGHNPDVVVGSKLTYTG
ncbi:hypothetical protein MSIMFI_02860 [Mycobacterium simulans]|uniref:DUF2971 domain-containing protein n=1 Tax=Mycobacterium simulans TaxID=627089 RepID=UPI00174BC8B7|nr:DUF2971 domain-containing protein [Mycobacterium simulans]SON61355.1 hypothetical protein MSIMFI_02860 [Mycobacterium simulans]